MYLKRGSHSSIAGCRCRKCFTTALTKCFVKLRLSVAFVSFLHTKEYESCSPWSLNVFLFFFLVDWLVVSLSCFGTNALFNTKSIHPHTHSLALLYNCCLFLSISNCWKMFAFIRSSILLYCCSRLTLMNYFSFFFLQFFPKWNCFSNTWSDWKGNKLDL